MRRSARVPTRAAASPVRRWSKGRARWRDLLKAVTALLGAPEAVTCAATIASELAAGSEAACSEATGKAEVATGPEA